MHGMSHPELAAEAREITPPSAAQPQALIPIQQRAQTKKWSLAGDAIARGTEQLPEFEREQLRWLGRYASSRNLSLDEVGTMLEKQIGSVV